PMPTVATTANNKGQRVVRISSLRTSVVVWNPTRGRNSPNASNAVTAASFRARAVSTRVCASPAMSDLFDIRAAEQTLWQEDESDRQNGKGGYIFVVD